MAYADIRQGRVIYILELTGVGVFATDTIDLSGEGWFTDEGYHVVGVKPWLAYSIDDIGDQIDYAVGNIEVNNIGLSIVDKSGRMTALTKSLRAWTHTWLTATLTNGGSTATVEDTSLFPSSGPLYIGHERMVYTGKSATTFTGLSRGTYGTEAVEHFADMDTVDGVPIQPSVATGPSSLSWRRALLRVAVIDEGTGTPGTSEVIYRGRVTKGARVGRGRYDITLEHVSAVLFDKIGTELPQSTLKRSYWYSGLGPGDPRGEVALGWVREIWTDHDTSADELETITTIPAGFHTAYELKNDWNDSIAITGTAFILSGGVGGGNYTISCTQSTRYTREFTIRKGDPLWALGFDVAHHVIPVDAEDWDYEAENEPRWCVVDLTQRRFGAFISDPRVKVEEGRDFIVDAWVAAEGCPHVRLDSVAADSGLLDFKGTTTDTIPAHSDLAWLIEEEDDAKVQHVIRVDATIPNALKQLLHLASGGQDEPDRWCAAGLTDDDIDWDELDAALGGVSPVLNTVYTTITEPTEVWEVIGSQLALLGICPRITSQGRIGFSRIRVPIGSDANSVELDEDIWASREAAGVEARIDEEPVVDEILLKYGLDYRAEKGGWRQPLRWVWREGARALGKSRSLKYDCPGLWAGSVWGIAGLELAIRARLIMTHFSIAGRESTNVEIPCVRTCRQILCGDVVSITHELAPDTVEGTLGVSGRLGIVVGRRLKLTDDGADTLVVRLGPATNGAGIAPCALISSDDGDVKGVVGDTALYSANDLSAFVAGNKVRLIEHNAASADTTTTQIGAIAGGTITFDDAVFDAGGTDMPSPCWMIHADWDQVSTSQRGYAYTADAAAAPSLGAGSDTPKEWVL